MKISKKLRMKTTLSSICMCKFFSELKVTEFGSLIQIIR